MKNNKGFTLAELLAIIVLILVFALIAGPNLTKQIESSDEESKNVLSKNIENASMIYAGKYYADKLVNSDYADVKFTLEDLIEDGLLDLDNNQCKKIEGKEYTRATQYIYFDGDFKFEELKSNYLQNCYKSEEE